MTAYVEDAFQLAQQLCPLLYLWHDQRHPASHRGSHPPEVKTKKSEALTSRQINDPALLLVHFHL